MTFSSGFKIIRGARLFLTILGEDIGVASGLFKIDTGSETLSAGREAVGLRPIVPKALKDTEDSLLGLTIGRENDTPWGNELFECLGSFGAVSEERLRRGDLFGRFSTRLLTGIFSISSFSSLKVYFSNLKKC